MTVSADWPLAAIRAVHFLAVIQLAGLWLSAWAVTTPALGIVRGHPEAARTWRRLLWLAWASLALTLASGAGWLALEAGKMSGRPLSLSLLTVTLADTEFGRAVAWRAVIAVPLLMLMAVGSRGQWAQAARSVLGLCLVAGLAWSGHAAAAEGIAHRLHLGADLLHVLAATAWLGGLVPLAWVLVAARRIDGREGAWVTARAAARFALVGMASVTLLVLTGITNAWFLIGTPAGLVGTPYGQLVLLKVLLLAALIAIAAHNRQVLTPRLSWPGETMPAARKLARNALAEAALGAAVLVVVGVLGTLVPALHADIWWPFSYRVDGSDFATALGVDASMLDAGAMALVCLMPLLVLPLASLQPRSLPVAAAVLLATGLALRPLLVPATPTSFRLPTIPYAVAAIVQGSALHRDRCRNCHTVDAFPRWTDGDLFWRITRHRDEALAAPLSDDETWSIVHFFRTTTFGTGMAALGPQVTADRAVPAPDFTWGKAGGHDGSLSGETAEASVLLVFFDSGDVVSRARLRQLEQRRPALENLGARILAISTGDAALPPEPNGLAVLPEPGTREAYAILDPALRMPTHVEFLLDRNGAIRARWRPDDVLDWRSAKVLARQIEALNAVKPGGGMGLGRTHMQHGAG